VAAALIAWLTVGTSILAPPTIQRTSPPRDFSTSLAVSAPFCTATQYGLFAKPMIAILALVPASLATGSGRPAIGARSSATALLAPVRRAAAEARASSEARMPAGLAMD